MFRFASSKPNTFAGSFPLCQHRAHEVCGSGAFVFASAVCGMSQGNTVWIRQPHQPERLHPAALTRFCKPERLIFAQADNHIDVLWTAEEALRSGAVSVVVAQIHKPITLTAGRRLQLAAEAGNSLGLFLIHDGMGSNAAETRWHCTPHYDGTDSTLHRWQLIKNKSGTSGDWIIRWDEQARRIIVVSKAGQREDIAGQPY